MNIDVPQVLSFLSGVAGLSAAYGAYRKLSLEGRDSVISNFQKIVEQQRSEIDRLIKRNADLTVEVNANQAELTVKLEVANKEHAAAIAVLTVKLHEQEAIIVDQAVKIRALEKNQQNRMRGNPE